MNSVTKIPTEQTAPAIMAEIKGSLDSLAAGLAPIASAPQVGSSVVYVGDDPSVIAAEEQAAMAITYIAAEVALASRFAGLLLEVEPDQAEQPVDTSGLTVMDKRMLSCVGLHETNSDAGESLGAYLGAVGKMNRWLIQSLERVDGLMPPIPALYLVTYRLDATEAHVASWVEVMMGRHAKVPA